MVLCTAKKSFAAWQTGPAGFRSELAPPPDAAQIALLAELSAFLDADLTDSPAVVRPARRPAGQPSRIVSNSETARTLGYRT